MKPPLVSSSYSKKHVKPPLFVRVLLKPSKKMAISPYTTRALRALVGVGLSLDPEGKEKGSWWHSTSDFVLIPRDAVVLLIVALGELLNGCQHPFGSEDDKGLENTGCQQSAGGFAAFGR